MSNRRIIRPLQKHAADEAKQRALAEEASDAKRFATLGKIIQSLLQIHQLESSREVRPEQLEALVKSAVLSGQALQTLEYGESMGTAWTPEALEMVRRISLGLELDKGMSADEWEAHLSKPLHDYRWRFTRTHRPPNDILLDVRGHLTNRLCWVHAWAVKGKLVPDYQDPKGGHAPDSLTRFIGVPPEWRIATTPPAPPPNP